MALTSFSRGQTAPIWLPGPGLALLSSWKDVCSSCMYCCVPILLRTLQRCIWDPWGAFGQWAYIEGMDAPYILFTGANGSDLAAWARLGTLALFERCLLLLYVLLRPNSSTHVATLYLGPMGSLWAYIEGMDAPYILFTGANGSDLAAYGPGLALLSSWRDVCSSCMYCCVPILLRTLQHCIWGPLPSHTGGANVSRSQRVLEVPNLAQAAKSEPFAPVKRI